MAKKSLQDWYNSNDINYSQKEIISKYGAEYCSPSEHELWNFKKIWCLDDILKRNITNLGISNDKLVHQMTFFRLDETIIWYYSLMAEKTTIE